MAKNETKPIDPTTIAEDRKILRAIQGMTTYTPPRPAVAITALTQVESDLSKAEAAAEKARNDLEAARDAHVEQQWAFHNAILAAKKAVIAQYGDDSDEVAAVGYVKASEKRSPASARKAVAAAK
jgi:hypothetical protein